MPIYGKIILGDFMKTVPKVKKDAKTLKKDISINIRKFRKERHYTQEELAEYADISYDFLRRIETTDGTCGFSVYTLYKLALALDVSLDDLADTIKKYNKNN